MSSAHDGEKKYKIGLVTNQNENVYPKSRTNWLLRVGTAPTDGGHIAYEDHLFGNKTELSDSVPKYAKQRNRLRNLQV